VPIELTETKTKSGHPVLRANFISEVTMADAELYHQRTPPGRYEDWGYLVVGNVTSVSSDVKKKLSSRKREGKPQPVAIVLTSPLMRMAASLVARLSGSGESETFRSEADALAWLDAQLTAAKKKG
jgi:hypothetical protein